MFRVACLQLALNYGNVTQYAFYIDQFFEGQWLDW